MGEEINDLIQNLLSFIPFFLTSLIKNTCCTSNLRTALVVYLGALSYSQPMISTSTRGEMKPLPDLLRWRAPNICQGERGQNGRREEKEVKNEYPWCWNRTQTGRRDAHLTRKSHSYICVQTEPLIKEKEKKKKQTHLNRCKTNSHISINLYKVPSIPSIYPNTINTASLSIMSSSSTHPYGEVEWSGVRQGEGVAWVIVRAVLEFRSQDVATFAILHESPFVQLHGLVWKKRSILVVH